MGGRWHIEGTGIPIAAIRAEASADMSELMQIYQSAGLTEEEVMLALRFEFPEVRAPELWSQYAAVSVACSCGEETHTTLSGFDIKEVLCACGRLWCIRLTIDPIAHRAD